MNLVLKLKNARYTDEFKAEAIKQITERGHGVLDVSKRLGVSDKSLYLWLKQNREQVSPVVTGHRYGSH